MINICGIDIADGAFEEELSLIIDHPRLKDEAEWEYGRSFMKSLGQKSDSVGWCVLKNPAADKLEEIFDLAEKERVAVRGIYEMRLKSDSDSEWYLIDTPNISPSLDISRPRSFTAKGKEYTVIEFANYLIPKWVDISNDITDSFGLASFREDIKEKLEAFGFTGGKFIWIPDCGRYEAPQFFSLECEHFISECYENNNSRESKRFETLTDTVRSANEGCKQLNITLPIGINKALMPECDFCGVRLNTDRRGLLISKRLRDFIVEECKVKADRFTPVLCFDSNPTGKDSPLLTTKNKERSCESTAEVKAETERLWQIHIKKKKPKRVATEKLALQKLKDAKRDKPEFFGKRASTKTLTDIPDERLLPYCKIADGGAISDEYRFLGIREMKAETADFFNSYALENSEAIPLNAVVIALSADGEHILLLHDGGVIRYVMGCESPDVEWQSLAEFFCDSIE